MAKRKDRRKMWASIIAAVLALAMALSAVAVFLGYLLDRDGDTVNPGGQMDIEAYREYYLGEVKRLQKYVDDYGPTVPVLGKLVEAYFFLIQIEKSDDEAAEETIRDYENNLKKFSRELVELEPDKPEHRLQLLHVYEQIDEDEAVIAGEIASLRELLHENPDPPSSLMLIEFMKSSKLQEEVMNEEIARLKEHFDQLEASGELDSESRYYYAYLLGEYLEEPQAAENQLDLIMEKEPEESAAYLAAKKYLEKLLQQKEKHSKEEK